MVATAKVLRNEEHETEMLKKTRKPKQALCVKKQKVIPDGGQAG